jgi:hypothetical protein
MSNHNIWACIHPLMFLWGIMNPWNPWNVVVILSFQSILSLHIANSPISHTSVNWCGLQYQEWQSRTKFVLTGKFDDSTGIQSDCSTVCWWKLTRIYDWGINIQFSGSLSHHNWWIIGRPLDSLHLLVWHTYNININIKFVILRVTGLHSLRTLGR